VIITGVAKVNFKILSKISKKIEKRSKFCEKTLKFCYSPKIFCNFPTNFAIFQHVSAKMGLKFFPGCAGKIFRRGAGPLFEIFEGGG
jgi:hypothetical protein